MTAVCTQCGHETERVLQAQFPHICLRCLFPSHVDVQAGEVAPEFRQHRTSRWVP